MTTDAAVDLPPVDPQALAATVERAWAAWLERTMRRERSTAVRDYVYASAWRACERRMVYEMTVPDQQLPVETDVLAKFRRGNDRERDLLVDLTRAGRDAEPGFTLVGQQQQFRVRSRDGRDVISGRIDGKLVFGNQKPETGAPLEVKAWSPYLIERIETFEDVFQNVWTQSGGYQLLAYLYATNVPYGFLLLDRSGIPRLLLVELTDVNYERMEQFLAKAERASAHVLAGTLPDYIDDAAECKRCPFFGTACQPPIASKTQDVLLDPELEVNLERWWELRAQGKEWRDLDDKVKRQLRGVESAVAGHFAITGTWSTYQKLALPPEVRKQYTTSDPKGRFSLDIARL